MTPSEPFDSGRLAWTRLCHKTVALAVAFAEFKLALDDYALMEQGGEVPAYPDISSVQAEYRASVSENVDMP